MLDRDLAELYGVSTSAFNQAVKRNGRRFPPDFWFRLTSTETRDWLSQIVISNPKARMGQRHAPWAFTEEGIAMLSGVLDSDRAIGVHIMIVRAFTRMRKLLATHAELASKLNDLERNCDATFKIVFEELRALRRVSPAKPPKPIIGFTP